MYTDWLLNRSIETQFKAFKKGFDLVIHDTSLVELFRPEEVELLVCGSKVSGMNKCVSTSSRSHQHQLPRCRSPCHVKAWLTVCLHWQLGMVRVITLSSVNRYYSN